jgi:DNA-binding CsgD family transcriptional regulator
MAGEPRYESSSPKRVKPGPLNRVAEATPVAPHPWSKPEPRPTQPITDTRRVVGDRIVAAEMVQRYRDGQTLRQIAAAMSYSTPTVQRVLRHEGVERRRPGPPVVQRRLDAAPIVALYREGLTRAQVAAEIGSSIGTVDARLNEAGIHGPRGNGPRDAEIVRRYQSGEPMSQVGVAMGMTKTAVHGVLRVRAASLEPSSSQARTASAWRRRSD